METPTLTPKEIQELQFKFFLASQQQQLLQEPKMVASNPSSTPSAQTQAFVGEKKTYAPSPTAPTCQAFKNCVVTYEPGKYGYGQFLLYNHKQSMPMMLFKKDMKQVLELLPKAFSAARLEQKAINDALEANGWILVQDKYTLPYASGPPLYKMPEDRCVFKADFKTYTNKAKGTVNDYFVTAESYEKNVLVWIKSVYYEEGKSMQPNPGGSSIMILVDEDLTPLQNFFNLHKTQNN